MNKEKAYLGIDIGSASIKMVVINEKEDVIDSIYIRNNGLVETIKKGFKKLGENINYEVRSVGVTGSGRKFTKLFVGADIIKTEILAHVVGTLKFYPNAKTISDIGGEDSKLMLVNEGVMEDFILNNSCSAGTGSSLESIATRMGIKIEDVGKIAMESKRALNISTKCGIFMTSMAINFLNNGAKKEDILWGVIKGMVSNYFTMAQGKNLQPPHIYTGMTARNPAIVKAFNEYLGYEVIVPKYAPLMGAIGMALISKWNTPKQTNFKGFDIANKDYETKIVTCQDCENACELTKLYEDKKLVGVLGSRCGKW